MTLFDTHVHIDASQGPDSYYEACVKADVPWLMACASDYQDSVRAAQFAGRFDKCLFSAGVHPHEAVKSDVPVSQFKDFSKNPKFAAIGEVGLDFYYENSGRKEQSSLFAKMLSLSLELGKPALVHCRDKDGSNEAYSMCFDLLSAFAANGGRFALHCFAGTPEWAEKFLLAGAMFGVGGMITFPKAQNIRDTVSTLPMDRILLETDAPYLAPVPHRGKPNHPSLLVHTAQRLAELKGLSLEETAAITTGNAFSLFGIDTDGTMRPSESRH